MILEKNYIMMLFIRVIKSRRMMNAGHVARMGRNVYKILAGKSKRNKSLWMAGWHQMGVRQTGYEEGQFLAPTISTIKSNKPPTAFPI
jgi:hypothetical protein